MTALPHTAYDLLVLAVPVAGLRGQLAYDWHYDLSANYGKNQYELRTETINTSLGLATPRKFDNGTLSNEQKQQAALLALQAAEQHLSMAAVNLLRAVWLAMNSNPELPSARGGVTIERRD